LLTADVVTSNGGGEGSVMSSPVLTCGS